MQKVATQIFIAASLLFGAIGISIVLIISNNGSTEPPEWLTKAFMISVFVILPSFALSVAGKYLIK